MKKLLSVVALLILAGALLPVQSHADLRGAFAPLTPAPTPVVNGAEQGAFRPGLSFTSGAIGRAEAFFSFSTRSLIVGSETVREVWLHLNRQQAGFFFVPWKAPLLLDPAAQISYADPAWSPNGEYLAYVKTDKNVTFAEIWVQQFALVTTSLNVVGATAPIGSPILVAGGGAGVTNRHPHWSPDGNSLVYDSNASGTSIDLYTVPVFPAVGASTRITFNSGKAEQMPSWSPDGTRVAYVSNEFGQFVIKILDLSTVPHPTDGTLADVNLAPVTHANPEWSRVSGDNVLYYDAPAGEDPNSPPDIWRLDLNTQQKCAIFIDVRGDYDVDVSSIRNATNDGIPFNYILFSSTATGTATPGMWRGNYINTCVPPLPMGISISPATLNVGSSGTEISARMSFPPETQAAGYVCNSANIKGREGVRMRISILASPTMFGRAAKLRTTGPLAGLPDFSESDGNETIDCKWSRRTIQARLIALGLTDKPVPVPVTAYSNRVGRAFKGHGYLTVATSNLAGSAIRMLQNSPNPFNPQTKITFAVNKPGLVEVRIFNVRGELVKTLARQWYPQGEHTLTWDGRTESGAGAPSGMYFATAKSNGATDKMKMMLMK